jgi:multiple sugar transport system permease protein
VAPPNDWGIIFVNYAGSARNEAIRPRLDYRSRKFYLWVFLAPTLIYLSIWKFVPLAYTIYLSFTAWNPIKSRVPLFVGLQNYAQILSDPAFLHSLAITALFTLVATAIELLLGLAVALLLDDEGVIGKDVYRTVVLLPTVIAPAVVGTIWYILYHDTYGPLSYWFNVIGIEPGWLQNPRVALFSIILTDIWHWTPFMFLLILSGLQVVSRELYDAASVDGASWFQTLRFVKLPLLRDTIIVALILRSMDAFRIFDEIMLMTGGGPGESTETTSVLIYKSAFKFFQMGYSSTLVVVLLLVTLILYSGYMRYMRLD